MNNLNPNFESLHPRGDGGKWTEKSLDQSSSSFLPGGNGDDFCVRCATGTAVTDGICSDCIDNGAKILHVGDIVKFNDPEGISSGVYTVIEGNDPESEEITLSRAGSECGAYDFEVTRLSTRLDEWVNDGGPFRVALTDIGEGLYGEYDPNDPDDAPLLRIDLQTRADSEWAGEPDYGDDDDWCNTVGETSLCTLLSAHVDGVQRKKFLTAALDHVNRAIADGSSPKGALEDIANWSLAPTSVDA